VLVAYAVNVRARQRLAILAGCLRQPVIVTLRERVTGKPAVVHFKAHIVLCQVYRPVGQQAVTSHAMSLDRAQPVSKARAAGPSQAPILAA
jgi:hypothetical protein